MRGVDLSLIINPSMNPDKVSDKAWDVTFDQDIIALDDLGSRDVDIVVLGSNCWNSQG